MAILTGARYVGANIILVEGRMKSDSKYKYSKFEPKCQLFITIIESK
jgi:hypothetical protein